MSIYRCANANAANRMISEDSDFVYFDDGRTKTSAPVSIKNLRDVVVSLL